MKKYKTKFPLLEGKNSCWVPFDFGKKCGCCGEKYTKNGEFICLDGGALKGNSKEAEMSSNLIGFLSITLHDHNYHGKGGYLQIAECTRNGQFEFYFCSTQCLRKFLNYLVDRFEEGLKS